MTDFDIPRSLKEALKRRSVVPFIGAGVSRTVVGFDGKTPLYPSWSELILTAAKEVEEEGDSASSKIISQFHSQNRLLDAAQEAKTALGPARWADFLKQTFEIASSESKPASRNILSLIWKLTDKLVITTNFDTSLRWACPDPLDLRLWDSDSHAEFSRAQKLGLDHPTIWHLHGRIDRLNSVALTNLDFKDLYNPLNNDVIAQRKVLDGMMSQKTIVFIGYSLSDKDLTAQIEQVSSAFVGTSGPHFVILKRGDTTTQLPSGLIPVYFDEYGKDFEDLIRKLVKFRDQGKDLGEYIPISHSYVSELANDGVYIFGGRGDKFLELYDKSIGAAETGLDVFSLSLSRFRKNHGKKLLELSKTIRIRIALIDPKYPMPKDGASLAAIREREENGTPGDIRRAIAAWHSEVWVGYAALVDSGELTPSDSNGLEIRLYSALPTVNLFRTDERVFVGPYLMSVADHHTPSMVFDAVPSTNNHLGTKLFDTYATHFESIWDSKKTRCISECEGIEMAAWALGNSVDD